MTENLGNLAEQYRVLLEERDTVNRQKSSVDKRIRELAFQLSTEMEEVGIEKFSHNGLHLTRKEQIVPEIVDFDAILASELAGLLVQRRISVGKLQQLIEDGIPLPEGLDYNYITKVVHRRTAV